MTSARASKSASKTESSSKISIVAELAESYRRSASSCLTVALASYLTVAQPSYLIVALTSYLIAAVVYSSQRDQAIRLLHWISCSYRPLKLIELREGTAFRPGHPAPDGRNIILKSIVELCGPLVEKISEGAIDAAHFFAKE